MFFDRVHLIHFFGKNNKNSLRAFQKIIDPDYDFSRNTKEKKIRRSSSLYFSESPYCYDKTNFNELQKMYLKYQIDKNKVIHKKKGDNIKLFKSKKQGSGQWEGFMNKKITENNKGKKMYPEQKYYNFHKSTSIDDLSNEKKIQTRFNWGNISHFENYIPKV